MEKGTSPTTIVRCEEREQWGSPREDLVMQPIIITMSQVKLAPYQTRATLC